MLCFLVLGNGNMSFCRTCSLLGSHCCTTGPFPCLFVAFALTFTIRPRAQVPKSDVCTGREENCFAGGGGGGMARKPICPNPPFPSLVAVPGGGFGLALPYLPCRGGGGGPTPTYMAQNDPHVALMILTTHMWGKIFSEKIFHGPKFVFRRLWWQHPSLHKTKGPARKPISGIPPPFAGRPCHPPPYKAIFRPPRSADRAFTFGATHGDINLVWATANKGITLRPPCNLPPNVVTVPPMGGGGDCTTKA